MKSKILLNAFILTFFLLIQTTYPQYDSTICGWSSSKTYGNTMPFKTPVQGHYLRALIFYVAFPDDNVQGPDWNIWEIGEPPHNPYLNNAFKLIDNVEQSNSIPFMNRYSPYTYSDWFCEMSMGEMDFIGDEYYLELPYTSEHYAGVLKYHSAEMSQHVLGLANQFVDFTRYDKWAYVNGNWEWRENGDGTAEMIIIHYRRIPHNDDPPGVGSLRGWFWDPMIGGLPDLEFSNPISLDGITIGDNNGITVLSGLNRLTRTQLIVEHELGHVSTILLTFPQA